MGIEVWCLGMTKHINQFVAQSRKESAKARSLCTFAKISNLRLVISTQGEILKRYTSKLTKIPPTVGMTKRTILFIAQSRKESAKARLLCAFAKNFAPLRETNSPLILALLLFSLQSQAQILKKPIPDKLIVLTFDDAVLSHYTNVAPLLKKYKLGGTFFIAEFLKPTFSDKSLYMSWDQIGKLNKMGFEIANHTQKHTHVNKMSKEQFIEELNYIESQARAVKVKKTMVSFAYPGYDTHPSAIITLKEKGYQFARVGGGKAYDPLKNHPYLIPSFSTSGNNSKQIYDAFGQAQDGKIVVLTIHGVPDAAHPWVTTPLNLFEEYLKFLYENHYKVIALRDLNKYINTQNALETIQPDFSKAK